MIDEQEAVTAPAACGNCGTTLAGAYCHACGQSSHLHRSLLHLVEEVLHGVLHFDTKAWRTLPLLVARPGLLTRRYIDGQRVRYVGPLALFLFTVFLMFFVVSLSGTSSVAPAWVVNINADAGAKRTELQSEVTEAGLEAASLQRDLDAARREQSPTQGIERELAKAQQTLQAAQAALAAFDAAAPQRAALAAMDPAASAPGVVPGVAPNSGIKTGNAAIDAAIERVAKNPELAIYKLKSTAYKFSFMLIPLSLPFLWLLFVGRSDLAMYDHAVFSLYSLSFMSLLITLLALLALTPLKGHLMPVFLLGPPLHMFLHLRGTYGLSKTGAFWRTVALLAVCGTVFVLFLLLVVWLGWH